MTTKRKLLTLAGICLAAWIMLGLAGWVMVLSVSAIMSKAAEIWQP